MTEEMFGLGDPVIRRLQQAFAHEEPTSELAAIMQRAAQYQVWEPPESDDAPVPHHDLTVADLVAARHREPAAVTRIYTAYAPALSRYFLAAVGDHRLAEDLTDTPLNRLSAREREILGLLANGWSNQRIAQRCYLSLHTVRTHVENIQVKLGVHSMLEAVAIALEHGWPPAADASEELVIDRLEGSRVMAAMRKLSTDQREVLLLRMGGGLTTPEVAEILGKTTGAVKALQHRGLASLARALGLEITPQTLEHPLAAPGPDHLPGQEKQQG